MRTVSHPLIKLPTHIDSTLFLICEELKSRKLLNTLSQAGFSDCSFQPHLDSLILQSMELDRSDETYEVYDEILEKRSAKIKEDQQSVVKQALKVYHELKRLKIASD